MVSMRTRASSITRWLLISAQSFRERLDDLRAVESSILDEDVAGLLPRDRAAGNEHVRDIGLQRFHVQLWREHHVVHRDSHVARRIGVGVVAGQDRYTFSGILLTR